MKSISKYIIMSLGILSFALIPLENTFSARLILPNASTQEDTNIGNTQLDNAVSNESTIFEYIKIINSYLWFSIGGIAMAILLFSGIQMITAGGDKAKIGKAGKMALYSFVGIFVAMLSYTIVNLIINLV